MEEYEALPEYSKEDLDGVFDETLDSADRLHSKLTLMTEDVGYIRNVLTNAKTAYNELFRKALNDPSTYPIVASGIDFLMGLNQEFIRIDGVTDEVVDLIGPATSSTGTFGGTVDAATVLWNLNNEVEPFNPPPDRRSRDHYSDMLRRIDPSLANLYDEVWQTYLGTSADPHRASLFMMRTLFDNFFAHLAPDEEVRNSRFWHRKDGEKPNQIWRSERIAYAVEKNIQDENRKAILQAEAKQIIDLYVAANSAHNRGELDEDKASKTLIAMDRVIHDWLDALNM